MQTPVNMRPTAIGILRPRRSNRRPRNKSKIMVTTSVYTPIRPTVLARSFYFTA